MTRNTTIDIAKGMAICLMVMGHCYCKENPILILIYAFHMPFFFIASGMLYAEKWRENVKINIKRTCAKLLLPYFFFEILFVLFLSVLQRPENFFGNVWATFVKRILPLTGNTVLWFLPCQLMVCILSALLIKIGAL